jgi:hypothetical protein
VFSFGDVTLQEKPSTSQVFWVLSGFLAPLGMTTICIFPQPVKPIPPNADA